MRKMHRIKELYKIKEIVKLKKQQKKCRVFALLMVLFLGCNSLTLSVSAGQLDTTANQTYEVVNTSTVTAEADMESWVTKEPVNIYSLDDFLSFADNCKMADYSKGLEVYLKEDLDLSSMTEGTPFLGINSFSGIFYGNGHYIRNLHLTEGSEAIGLFCHLEEGAIVRDLVVTGTLESGDAQNRCGAIVGINGGTVRNCTFKGGVSCVGITGGIVGLNGAGGAVVRCMAKGLVESPRTVGGIVGRNCGVISDCTNEALVNSDSSWLELETDSDISFSPDSLTITVKEGLQENFDFGGIAGYSEGIIAGCKNKAVVGLMHTGRNVGGIVGRQRGEVIQCTNEGRVFGKQDVGGIVGQFEPSQTPEDEEEISQAVNELHELMENMIEDMEALTQDLHENFFGLNQEANEAADAADALVSEMKRVIDENIEVINELSSRVDYAVSHFGTVMTYVNQSTDLIDTLLDDCESIKHVIDNTADQIDDDTAIQEAKEELQNKTDVMADCMGNISDTTEAIRDILTDDAGETKDPDDLTPEEKDAFNDYLVELLDNLSQAGSATGDVLESANTVIKEAEPYTDEAAGQIDDELDKLFADARSMNDALQEAGREMKSIVDYLNALEDLEMTKAGSELEVNSEKLRTRLDNISEILSNLDRDLNLDSLQMEKDMKAVNDKLNEVFRLLIDKIEYLENMANGEDVLEDLSAKEPDSPEASKVTGCTNKGVVRGDRNVGGIVGSLAIEGRDSKDEKKITLGKKYITRGVLRDCTNLGFIRVRTENAGGIVGSMEVGMVQNCIGCGKVDGEAANYIGGIAGISRGVIDQCSCLAVLRGEKYIGGIAGEAQNISNCFAMPTILSGEGFVGAVAGVEAKEEEEQDLTIRRNSRNQRIFGNFYVSDTLYGINGISYAGVAEPISYEELLDKDNVPSVFSRLSVTFLDAEENMIARTELPYGTDLTDLEYPDMLTKDGDYMEWEGLLGDTLTGNLVIWAVETPRVTILNSDKKEDSKSVALAEGAFTEAASLLLEEYEGSLPLDLPVGATVKAYCITLEQAELTTNSVTRIRLLNSKKEQALVYKLQEGVWKEVPSKSKGSYEQFEMTGDAGIFCMVTWENSHSTAMVCLLIVLCLSVVLLTIVIVVRNVKGKKRRVDQASKPEE